MSSPADAVRRPGQWTARPRHAGPPGRPVVVYAPSSTFSPGPTGPIDPPTEPIPRPALSGQGWADSSLGPMSSVSAWLIAVAAIVLMGVAGVVGVLGLTRPGFFLAPVLDQASVRDGVGMILRDAYQLPDVDGVNCPAGQRVMPGRSFTCVATIGGRRSAIPVVIEDGAGRYQVGRPAGEAGSGSGHEVSAAVSRSIAPPSPQRSLSSASRSGSTGAGGSVSDRSSRTGASVATLTTRSTTAR